MAKARLRPLAKKPPNGAITEENNDIASEWKTIGYVVSVVWNLIAQKSKKYDETNI